MAPNRSQVTGRGRGRGGHGAARGGPGKARGTRGAQQPRGQQQKQVQAALEAQRLSVDRTKCSSFHWYSWYKGATSK